MKTIKNQTSCLPYVAFHQIKALIGILSTPPLIFPSLNTQNELERLEEEQTFQELQSLRQIVYDWFQKQEEIAEVVWKILTFAVILQLTS